MRGERTPCSVLLWLASTDQPESIDFVMRRRVTTRPSDSQTERASVVEFERPRMTSVAGSAGSQFPEIYMAGRLNGPPQHTESSRRVHGRSG